jgi:heme-degrading monooxygenase HmoA
MIIDAAEMQRLWQGRCQPEGQPQGCADKVEASMPKSKTFRSESEDASEPKVARIWHGVTPKMKRAEFVHYVGITGMKDLRESEGNRGAYLFTRDVGDNTEFLLISLWDSEESIRKFAGDDIKKPRYYKKDSEYLAELEPSVTHFEVAGTV